MSTPTSPAQSPRASTAAPLTQPSEVKGPTRMQIAFTPGGSSVIKDNLIRVYENKEYRIYGAYLTGVTAIRSAVEIIPSVGKLLLNTGTWFIDLTSPRGDGITIFARDFADVINCIKTAIALPFFSIAGFVFPTDVFGLFENMPGIQTKVEILDEKALLARVKAKKASEEIDLTEAEEELAEVRKDLEDTDETLTLTKAQLNEVRQQIEGSKDAAAHAEKLRTDVISLKDTVAKLRSEEVTVSATLGRIHSELTRLGSDLVSAKESNTTALDSLETERIAKQEQLQRIQDQIKQAGEKQAVAQDELDRLSAIVRDLTPKAAALHADVEKLEAAKPVLIEQERALIAKIQSHENKLQELEAQVTAAKEKTSGELKALGEKIAAQKTELEIREATLERLGREKMALDRRRDALDKQCRELEHKTLHDLNGRKETLGRELESLDAQKAALGKEIAAQTEALYTEKKTAETAATRVYELKTTIAELELNEGNFRDTVLPELERQSKTLEQQKAALSNEVSAEEKKLEEVKSSHADTLRELDSATRTLDAKRADQASLELTLKSIMQAIKGSPDSGAAAAFGGSPEQTIAALHEKLKTLGTSVAEETERDTELKGSVTEQRIALRATMQAVESLKKDSSFLDQKVGGLKAQEAEITSHLSRLGEEIKKLEAKEKAFKEQNEAFEKQVRTSTEALDKITAQHKGLEAQVRAAEEKKAAAEKALKGLSDQVTAAQQTRGEIQGVIDGLKLNIDSMKSSLTDLEVEQARLGEALPKLRVEEQALTRQIDEGKQELSQLKETSARTHEAHISEMRTLEEARTRLSNEKTRLESEIEARNIARNALQLELDSLMASTEALRGQKTTLEENVRAAEVAQKAAIARTDLETEAHKKLQDTTLALDAQVQALTQKSSAMAEANQKQAAEFETKRAAFDEELRQEKQEAVTALQSELQAIRQRSPAKAKLQSPVRTTESSDSTEDLETAEAKLGHMTRALERKEKKMKEHKGALAVVRKEIAKDKAEWESELKRLETQATAARKDRDRLRMETALARKGRDDVRGSSVPGTPAKPGSDANGRTDGSTEDSVK